MKTTVVYHSADFDGIFCREIARKFLPDAELIGWDFSDKPLPLPREGQIYVLDLPADRPFALDYGATGAVPAAIRDRLIWIDHHKSSIYTHPADIPGYRIDGVAACRLAWQYFSDRAVDGKMIFPFMHLWSGRLLDGKGIPTKEDFIDRKVSEPAAVRLAGEYDIWDKRDPDAELFQHGLRSRELSEADWRRLLETDTDRLTNIVDLLLGAGKVVQYAKTQENASIIQAAGFTIQFEGLTFLACNHARYNSFLFTAGLKPEHDACFGFAWRGGTWNVSLYHAPGKEHHDLSEIAKKHGGGGHRGACGFTTEKLPFIT